MLCRDGAMMSLRRKIADKSTDEIQKLTKEDLEEPITSQDFQDAIKRCKTSVSPSDISAYDTWMKEFGSYWIIKTWKWSFQNFARWITIRKNL